MFFDKGTILKFLLIILCLSIFVGIFLFVYQDVLSGENTNPTDYSVNEKEIRVHFIDVGQGDCALVETSSGNMLIDAGTPESKKAIINYIDSLGISEFEYAIFTHPHSDHIGSAESLLNKYTFKNVILPDAVSNSKLYEDMLDTLETKNCNVIKGEAGKSFTLDEAAISLFAPREYYYLDDLNDLSVVTKLTYKDVSFLFTGDAEEFSERQMIKHEDDLQADILKVGHHGSNSSSHMSFLKAVNPSVAIISCAEINDYGHPHDEVLERLEEIDADVYVTFESGSIVVSTDGTEYKISTEK